MFTLHLHYPHDSIAKGAVEEVRSSYVPQIGMEIYGKNTSAYRVTNVLTEITNGVLSAKINVLLEMGNG